jgi:hypothetical protein
MKRLLSLASCVDGLSDFDDAEISTKDRLP